MCILARMPERKRKRLLVLGPNGVMGQRVTRLAREHIPGVEVIGGSRRNADRTVDIHDAGSVRAALTDVDCVINTVGAFEYDLGSLLGACFETETDYIDIAEPVAFIDEARRRTVEAGNPVRVASGCSTLPGLAVLYAQRWAERTDVAEVRVYLSLGSNKPVSPTLLYSLLRPLGRTATDGARYYRGIVSKPMREGGHRYYGRYPAAFEASGITLGERVVPAPFCVGMDRAFIAWILRLFAPVLPTLSDRALLRWCKLLLPFTAPIRKLGGPIGLLCLEARDAQGQILDEVEVRAERRGLDIPALPAVWAAKRFLTQDRDLPRGFLPFEAIADEPEVTTWLRGLGYEVWFPEAPARALAEALV